MTFGVAVVGLKVRSVLSELSFGVRLILFTFMDIFSKDSPMIRVSASIKCLVTSTGRVHRMSTQEAPFVIGGTQAIVSSGVTKNMPEPGYRVEGLVLSNPV